MIPLRDTIPSRNYPIVNTLLIVFNVLIFIYQFARGPVMDEFTYVWGLVPARYTHPDIAAHFTMGQQVLSFVSYMFLHGGFLHLLGNMWTLYIFGDNVEDRLGPFRYLAFFLLCGVLSGFTHLMFNMRSPVPTIGASGAIAGVMGAYFLLYPHSRILTLIPIIIIPYFVVLPAYFFLGLWFVLQFLNASGIFGNTGAIAWWAHIGGFVFGMILIKIVIAVPGTGITKKAKQVTEKKHSERLQVIRTAGTDPKDPNLYGNLNITPNEGAYGTKKMVNIPWGFQNRLYSVTVPPGTAQGDTLRLKGLGKITGEGTRGDLYLRVRVNP